jgi:hypothetical protein
MKTTSEELENMSYEWCLEANDEHLDPRDFYPSPQSMDAFKAGFKACEAKMLAEASDSYNEHEMAGDVARFAGINRMSYEDVAEYFFAAGEMLQAKRDAEMEKFLVSIINWDNLSKEEMIIAQELHQKHFPENYKQGGEK